MKSFPAPRIDERFNELTVGGLSLPLLMDSTEGECFRYRLGLGRCIQRRDLWLTDFMYYACYHPDPFTGSTDGFLAPCSCKLIHATATARAVSVTVERTETRGCVRPSN